jgi:hypothetical protein
MALSSITISLFCFACIFCGALIGLCIRRVLPEHHLSDTTWDSIKIGAGLIATLTALVLGLLVSSAKSSYDTLNSEISQAGAKIILLDRVLSRYGPETKFAREELRRCIASGLEIVRPEGGRIQTGVTTLENRAGIDEVQDMVRRLAPQNDYQRSILAQAMGTMADLTQSRWLVFEQLHSSLPMPFLVILVLWLTVFFMCFGLLSEANSTVVTVMFVCALSVTGAIFLILEMNNPLQGMIKVSLDPLHMALGHLVQ